MERLRIFLKKAFSYPELLFKTHPVTAGSIIATTILFAVYTFINSLRNWKSSTAMDIFLSICLTILYFSVFALFVESIRPARSKIIRPILFALFGVLSFFMGFIFLDTASRSHLWFYNMIEEMRTSIGTTSILIYISALVSLSSLLAMYFSYGHDVHQNFNRHVFNFNSKVFLSSIIYGVIQLGVVFLTLIVMLLLYDDAFDYLPTILVLINGLFYVPAVLYCMTHENEDANTFMQVIVRYISLVISLIAFVIIYIYMIKLVVTASVPSNSVFAILSSLFVVSMFISYMCTTFEEKGPLQKFAYNCPLIFAPFILMQCYTMFVRIGQYGLTPMRYFGLAFILFEIVYILYYATVRIRDKEVAGSPILLILCAFILISVFVPGINARSLSTSIAKHNLRSYLKKVQTGESISDKEIIHANASYGFLSDDDFGKGKIERYFSGIDEDTVSALSTKAREAAAKYKDDERKGDDYYESDSYGWYHESVMEITGSDSVDISGYNKMIFVHITDSNNGDRSSKDPVDTTRFNVSVRENNNDNERPASECPTIDLTSYCSDFNAFGADFNEGVITRDEFNRRCRRISVIDVNENVRLYITDADIGRDSSGRTIYADLEGCMLIK